MKRFILITAMLTLSACGGSGEAGSSGDPRAAAIQAMLDKQRVMTHLSAGKTCLAPSDHRAFSDPNAYHKAGATLVAAGAGPNLFGSGTTKCWNVIWPQSYGLVSGSVMAGVQLQAEIGHQVVDKIGEEQDGPMGVKVTPFKAHFVPNSAGSRIIAAGLAERPPNMVNGQAAMRKDADGNWVAQ